MLAQMPLYLAENNKIKIGIITPPRKQMFSIVNSSVIVVNKIIKLTFLFLYYIN
jgi:hypothetical protein